MELQTRIVYDILIIFALSIGFGFILRLIKANYPFLTRVLNVEDEQTKYLKARITELENEVKNLKATQEILIEQLRKQNIVEVATPQYSVRPVLLVYGNQNFGEQDRVALRRAGISFFRITNAKLEDLRDEIQRRRSDGTLYDIVHLAAKGVEDGFLELNGQIVDGAQLSDVMSGVRGVFLSTCSNRYIADQLVGVVKYVVVIYEDISGDEASAFVYEFYKRYRVDKNIDAAFRGAIDVLPSIAEFVDLRKGT